MDPAEVRRDDRRCEWFQRRDVRIGLRRKCFAGKGIG